MQRDRSVSQSSAAESIEHVAAELGEEWKGPVGIVVPRRVGTVILKAVSRVCDGAVRCASDDRSFWRDVGEPYRTCVTCRERATLDHLIRFVLSEGSKIGVVPDIERAFPGRGGYCHLRRECWMEGNLVERLKSSLRRDRTRKPRRAGGARSTDLRNDLNVLCGLVRDALAPVGKGRFEKSEIIRKRTKIEELLNDIEQRQRSEEPAGVGSTTQHGRQKRGIRL